MDLSASSREDPFSAETFFSKQELPVVPNDNPETYCRLCLTTPEVEPLFPVNGEPNVYVMELIGKYIGIGLTIQDDYPCAVCRSCHLILDQFDLFRQNCLKVDIAIRRRRLGLDLPPVEVKSEALQDEEDNEEEMPYIRVERNHYQCRFCAETFRSLAMFLTHCKEDHPEESRMFKCKQCNKAFMTKTARLQHIRSHQPNNGENDLTGDRVQVCEKCMVTFDSYKLLKIHLKENHSNDPKQDTLVCGTCSKQFSRITILRNHILRVHMGKLPHVCKQCGVSFGYTQQLVTHLKDQHGIIVDQLNQSGQSSNAEDELDQTDELPYIPVAIPQSPDLQQTQQPQTSEDPPLTRNHYTCSECSAQCGSQEDLRTHRKLHQDPTWWKCTHCRNFVKHQKMHLMKKHPTIDPEHADASFLLRYRCWLCRVYFKSLQQMEQHVAARHGVVLPPSLAAAAAAAAAATDGEGSIPLDEDGDGGEEERAGEESAMMPPPAPLPLTVQPPGLPFLPEHLPLLLSQMENGAWDYLREMTRLMDPANLAAFAAAMKIKTEISEPQMATAAATATTADDDDDGVVDLSTNSAASMSTLASDDTLLLEQDDEQDSSEEEHNYIRLDNRLYQCRFCSETFRHLLLIRKHTKAAHPTEWKSFKCPHCKRRFPSAAIRDRHAHFHTLQHQFVCGSCDQMYDSKKRLEQHVAAVHDPGSANYTAERLRCGACRLSFTEKKYFDMHLKIYHQRKPQRLKNLTDRLQVCERCVTTFESREALQEHVRQVHKTDQPLRSCECPKCGKDLKTTTLLRTHILVVHLGHLPFVCQHCEAAFSTRHWLLKHIEKDHAEATVASTALEGTDFIVISQPTTQPPPPTTMIEAKPPATAVSEESTPTSATGQQVPLKCTGCDEYFDDSDKLSVHVTLVHAAVPPKMIVDPESGLSRWACGKCEKQYTSREELEKHVLKAHPTFMLLYKCPLCVKPIRYRKQHMRVHHDTEYDPKEHHYQTRYKCHCCSKLFKSKRNLTSHQNTLLFQCDKCHMRFKTKKSFQSHAAIHRANKSMLKCSDCGLEFGYRARLEEHRNRYHNPDGPNEVLKLLNCPYCPRLFISASNRERHVTINHPQSGFLVSCGHCDGMQSSDSAEIRRHYREVHPNERVTFKCAECVNRIYLNFSSYKDHYKAKHTGGGDGTATGSEQSFSGESSSAAESSFNGGQEGGFAIKQETVDAEVEDSGVAIKVEPNKDEEPSDSATIVQDERKETETMEEKVEISDDTEKPLEEARVLEPSANNESLPPTVELTEKVDDSFDKIEDSEDLKKESNIVDEEKQDNAVTEVDSNQTEESPVKLDDKSDEKISISEPTTSSTEEKLDQTPEHSDLDKVENESEVLPPVEKEESKPESDNKIDEPIPPKAVQEPEEIPPVADDVTPSVEAQSEPEPDTVASEQEETKEAEPPVVSAENNPEPEVPEPEAKQEEPDTESPAEPILDQKCTDADADGGSLAKRARTEEPSSKASGEGSGDDGGGDGDSNVEVVDKSILSNGPSTTFCEERETVKLAEEESDNLSEVTTEDQPPAKRGKRKFKISTTKLQLGKSDKAQSDNGIAANRKLDLRTAVILLPKIQLPTDVLEAFPKLEFAASLEPENKVESQKIPESIPQPVTPVLKLVDCLGQNRDKVAPCAISLTRLNDDICPPVRNREIPLNKCPIERNLRELDPTQPIIPRKKRKLQSKPKVLENGHGHGHHRRLIPRFLTCKRCGLGGIARTSFSAHRNKCLRLEGR